MCPSIQPLRLSERCDSDRGISKKSEYTQERKIRERVFELHAIKLSIPSCLNLLEREAAARYIGPFSSRRRKRRRTHLYSNVFSFPLASIFLETLLHLRSNFIQRSLIPALFIRAHVEHGDWLRILIIRYPCIVSF